MGYGSIPMGPSELYLQLLKGEISPEMYAKQAKKRLGDSRKRPVAADAQQQRA